MEPGNAGQRIAFAMKVVGIGPNKLEALAGLNKGVGTRLKGRKNPTFATLEKIAPHLETTVEWLQSGRGPGPRGQTFIPPTEEAPAAVRDEDDEHGEPEGIDISLDLGDLPQARHGNRYPNRAAAIAVFIDREIYDRGEDPAEVKKAVSLMVRHTPVDAPDLRPGEWMAQLEADLRLVKRTRRSRDPGAVQVAPDESDVREITPERRRTGSM